MCKNGVVRELLKDTGSVVLSGLLALAIVGCSQVKRMKPDRAVTSATDSTSPVTGEDSGRPSFTGDDIPRFAANSPFRDDYDPPTFKEGKRLWARSFLWEKAPDLVVEEWLTEKPETKGKYVMIEFWATWCSPCRRSIPLLNRLHRKYAEELVVIGVSDESESDVRKLKDPRVEYFSAIDTQARTKQQLGVFGIPHAVILEPEGYVVWEGFPLQPGYELTEETVEKILAVGRRLSAGTNEE